MKRKTLISILFFFIVGNVFSQDSRFLFGLRTALSLTQIEGDNLRGFKKLNYELGLQGGYRFTPSDAFQLSFSYEQLGSNREGENVPLIPGNYLSEVRVKQLSLYWAYARSFGADWDGSHSFQASAGLKYNRVLSTSSNLIGANIIDNFALIEEDFKSNYLSVRMGCSMFAGTKFLVGLYYEHGLESLIKSSEELPINKLIPFGLSLNVSYLLY